MKRLSTTILAMGLTLTALALTGLAAPALAEKRIALVIGNGAYATLPRLANPANDATDMAATLKGLGFELVGGGAQTDLARRPFLKLLREFAERVAPGDVALFYYAGHGLQVEGANYMAPVDDRDIRFQEDVPDLTVALDTLRRQLAGKGASPLIVILDACRDNPLPSRDRSTSRGLARLEMGGGTYIAFATAPGGVASDGVERNGRFTAALLEALRRPDRRIEDIFIDVAVRVERESGGAQSPWTSSNLRAPFHFSAPTPDPTIQQYFDPRPRDHLEVAFWNSVKDSRDPAALQAYLDKYPSGGFEALAKLEMARLRSESAVAAVQAPTPVPPPVPSSRPSKVIRISGTWPDPGSVFKDCAKCPEMVVVPGGSFVMGSAFGEIGRSNDEGPQHRVAIPRDFAVGKYEVTQSEWRSVMGTDPSRFKGDRLPVELVSWDDAQAFTRKLSERTGETYRLLTEAEWEYVARAGTTTPYSNGWRIMGAQANFKDDLANNVGSGSTPEGTTEVGSYSANPFGLYDLHGNVWEWVQDCHTTGYDRAPTDGTAVEGDHSCERVQRGGAWNGNYRYLRSASRGWFNRGDRLSSGGFRIARTLR